MRFKVFHGGAAALVLAAALPLAGGATSPALKAEVEAGIDALYRMDYDLQSRRPDVLVHFKEALAEPDRWGYKEYAERALKRPFVLEGEFTVDPR